MSDRRLKALGQLVRLRRVQEELQSEAVRKCLDAEREAKALLDANGRELERLAAHKSAGARGALLDLERYQQASAFEDAALQRRARQRQAHDKAILETKGAQDEQSRRVAARKAVGRREQRVAGAQSKAAELKAFDHLADILAGVRQGRK